MLGAGNGGCTLIGRRNVVASFLVSVLLAVLVSLPCAAQEAAATDIWRLAPSNSILVAAYDGRPDNPSVKALAAAADPQTLELRAKQHADLRKAVENLATLFGVSLDFAKDIDSWADQQWALVVLPDEKAGASLVFMVASKNAASANAALQKILAPWQRVGGLASETESDCPITVFKMKNRGIEVYASGCGTLAAFSTSKASLLQVLKGGGMTSGSPGEKVLKALSGSMLYAFADPALLKMMKVRTQGIPVAGFGLGISAVETGMKIRVLGLPDEAGAAMLKQAFPPQMAFITHGKCRNPCLFSCVGLAAEHQRPRGDGRCVRDVEEPDIQCGQSIERYTGLGGDDRCASEAGGSCLGHGFL